MDALSSKTFQPIQPDGFVLSSLGKETPKIEITGTESLCQDPLSPTACDVPLCEWDDLHHHGNNGVPADCLVEQSGSHHHSDASDHRRGSLSRRSEGGPGKCPSPSRNSPRRHSPVPYSPKRQNRTRSSASSVASEEFPDVTLSPRRHSPVPSSPQAERPSSLSLASGPAEEFICVSYTDPFCSPTITHTSEAILAISINCSHDGDQDVDMIPQDNRGGDSGSGVDGADVSSPPLSSSATGSSGNDSQPLLHEDSDQGSSSKTVCESQAENGHDMTDMSIEAEGRNSLQMESSKSGVGDFQRATASGSGVNVSCKLGRQQLVGSESKCSSKETGEEQGVEFMESEDDLHVDEVTDSDSSSDDEMVDFVSPPHPHPYDMCVTMNYSPGARAMSDCRNNNPHAHCSSSLANCSQHHTKEALQSSCVSGCPNSKQANDTASIACTSSDSSDVENMQTAAIAVERNQSSAEHCAAQSLPKELGHPSCSVTGSWAARRASFPDHQSRMPSLSACSSKESSPRRSLSHHVSKTPDDFALCCVVGSPPLTFPHCQHAVLVHCSLPSPYDPDLPTPPIVLTPHTSYEDLNCDPVAHGAGSGVKMIHKGSSSGRHGDAPVQNPSISRSRSFPKLNRNEDQFQEPDQPWPVLGSGQCRSSDDLSEGEQNKSRRQWENRRSSDSSYGFAEVSDMGDCSIGATTSVSLPGSPSNSRQAVIGRLRRVVERRLSGTSDTMEDALQGAASQ